MTKHEFLLESINNIKDETMSLILDELDLDLNIINNRYYISVVIVDKKSNNIIFDNHFYTDDRILEDSDIDTRLLYQSYKNTITYSIIAIANYDLIHKINKETTL